VRFSEERINDIAKKIASDLIDKQAIDKKVGASNLASLVAQAMIKDLKLEEQIDAETREDMMRHYRNLPPEGTGEYEAIFIKTKQKIAKKHGFPL